MDPSVDLEAFRTLRAHLNAAYNNDGAALSAVYRPYSTFGADYSAPSTRYISDRSKNHGYSGSFRPVGPGSDRRGKRGRWTRIRRLLELPPPPLATFGEPLLDDVAEDWCDRARRALRRNRTRGGWRGSGRDMEDCTIALGRLAANLERLQSNYSMRYVVLGLCCWLFAYLLRQGSDSSLLLVDALQGSNPRIRAQSRASYARALDLFSSSYDRANSRTIMGRDIPENDWNVFAGSAEARQILDDHFRDLGVRIGIVQPRSAVAKAQACRVAGGHPSGPCIQPARRRIVVLTLPEFAAQAQT